MDNTGNCHGMYDMHGLHEECGVFGIYGADNAASLTYYGLHSLQHRGQEELIAEAKATTDPAARMDLMHQAEDLIMGQDWALNPLYYYTQMFMLDPSVQGMYYTPLGYFFFDHCTTVG